MDRAHEVGPVAGHDHLVDAVGGEVDGHEQVAEGGGVPGGQRPDRRRIWSAWFRYRGSPVSAARRSSATAARLLAPGWRCPSGPCCG